MPNKDIRWETTEITNAGVDISIWDGKLSFTAEYFYKKTSDILYSISVSDVLGLEPSEQNYGVVENKGVEFDLSYNEDIGDLSFSIDPNISFLSNNVKDLFKVTRDIDKELFVGEPLQAIYGYKTDGLFVDEQDVNNWPEQKIDEASPGKIRYKDINGDGIVDANDRTVIGTRLPTTTYGIGITSQYKNFDFYLQLEGAAGQKSLPYSSYGYAFQNGGNVEKWQWENRWKPEDPSRNAKYPRMQPYNDYADKPSEFWLKSSAYLRIKNVQLAYAFSKIANILNVRKVRVYINARNLVTIDNFYQGWDPVMTTNQELRYPPTRLINAGININL